MTVFTVLLIFTIVRFSQRITENLSKQNRNKRLKRDMKISTSLIFINIFYIILVSPVSMASVHLYQASIMSLLFTWLNVHMAIIFILFFLQIH